MGDQDDSPTQINQYGILLDPTPPNSDTFPTPLLVTAFQQSNSYIREQSTYSFQAKTTLPITTNQYIFIDFPTLFGKLLELQPPSECTLQSMDPTPTLYSKLCSVQGNRVALKIETPIPANNPFQIQLQGLTNPEQSLCNVQKHTFSLLSPDNSTVLARSTIATTNIYPY